MRIPTVSILVSALIFGLGSLAIPANGVEVLWSQYCQHLGKMKLHVYLNADPAAATEGGSEPVELWLRDDTDGKWKLAVYGRFPGDPERIHLGSFTLPQGLQKGRFQVHSEELADFLREHSGSEITLKVVRVTRETEDGGLVHGFASRRHPFFPAPTLAIRKHAPLKQ